jgi:dCTP diphosphatase
MEKKSVLDQLREFVAERDWSQFHSSENLAKSVSIEAAELLELFQWDSEVDDERLRDEIADVSTYCYLLAARAVDSTSGRISFASAEVSA